MYQTIYLSMDANFKLKQKERGFSDPPLANGHAYMVSNDKLMKHLDECKGDKLLGDEVIPYSSYFTHRSLLCSKPSLVVRTFMRLTKLIQNIQLDTPSLGLRVWTVPAMGLNDHSGWWTYKKGNGMLPFLFPTDQPMLTDNQLRQRGPRALIHTSTRCQVRNQMRPCVL